MVNHRRIVALTGAGISAESGLSTFRAADGLWEDHRIEDVATPAAFARDPALVHRFYNARRAASDAAKPNPAHVALAALQTALARAGGALTLVTQNVDDLHRRAGAEVIHMHGSLGRLKCAACETTWPHSGPSDPKAPCPNCARPATRPDIVWFGEMPYHMEAIFAAIGQADLFVSIGTSGTVYPAAGFVAMAREAGAATLELNLARSHGVFETCRQGPASVLVPEWCAQINAQL
ncbi:NAD-dependent protein deacylase [Aquimixticola soesokkakensis]|uniref:NAD-dependent protein deacylase n=1 Tax=Aquimixticola soesokkakensis TaxID=1519096 RepID=A0A1Y5TMS5_9RHOB|nr:NAD-dependent deacylase [Aquimixticola soesokkakensis]SLN67258.1 NAD-dependent protein deacylase [Aquimixticola soesokkakensis]